MVLKNWISAIIAIFLLNIFFALLTENCETRQRVVCGYNSFNQWVCEERGVAKWYAPN
jgi:hypothetical protein